MDGEAVVAVDGVPDNSFADTQPVTPPLAQKLDPDGFGNHVAIRAADGRVSWLFHMEAGGVTVKKGQRVKAGDLLGKIGFSGDALFPHEHYTVTDAAVLPRKACRLIFGVFTAAREVVPKPWPIAPSTLAILSRMPPTACTDREMQL